MGDENKVILHGTSMSPYSLRVELALKLKGIPYEMVQEDLKNKSQSLLRYNPVHKKIPVLVHNGKPISESLVIVEYIDETWKTGPRFLPEDPYQRSKVRFWTTYLQQQLLDAVLAMVKTEGETQEKALKEITEKLKVVEKEGLKEIFPASDGNPTVTKESMNMVDIMMCTLLSPYKAQEEVLGVKVVDPENIPGVKRWLDAINEVEVVKELNPGHEKLVEIIGAFRQWSLAGSQ